MENVYRRHPEFKTYFDAILTSEDFEQQFTATSTYENTQTLNSVQEELVTQMVKEITDQIFNATVANW